MQKRYTGQTDKTGRKIYEGDLYESTLEVDAYDAEFGHTATEHKIVEPVIFEDGDFYHAGDLLDLVVEHDDSFKYVGDEE